jgi:hypothetical protein
MQLYRKAGGKIVGMLLIRSTKSTKEISSFIVMTVIRKQREQRPFILYIGSIIHSSLHRVWYRREPTPALKANLS